MAKGSYAPFVVAGGYLLSKLRPESTPPGLTMNRRPCSTSSLHEGIRQVAGGARLVTAQTVQATCLVDIVTLATLVTVAICVANRLPHDEVRLAVDHFEIAPHSRGIFPRVIQHKHQGWEIRASLAGMHADHDPSRLL